MMTSIRDALYDDELSTRQLLASFLRIYLTIAADLPAAGDTGCINPLAFDATIGTMESIEISLTHLRHERKIIRSTKHLPNAISHSDSARLQRELEAFLIDEGRNLGIFWGKRRAARLALKLATDLPLTLWK